MDTNEIEINGVTFVRKESKTEGMPYVIIRAQSAGVFAGYLKEKLDTEVTLLEARRLWYWSGAASLSQLAMEGTKKPLECKFPIATTEATIKNWVEILPVSNAAKISLQGVAIWKA